jgi:penicillin-binding protein 2
LPGSTVKPLVLSAAITDRKIGHEGTVQCNGMMNPQKPNVMRCWLYKNYYPNTHGSINGDEAIKHSCNIFFFTMGKKLRFRQLVTWYARLGLGQPTRCGLTEEVRGLLPDVKRAGESGYGIQEAMMMGIGQGPIAWTPIQACKAYGTIARSGSLVHPTFLGANAQPADHPGQDWHFDPRSTERALLGLYKAANERGATISLLSHPLVRGERIFNILDDQPELRIMAKSGTADTGVTWIDVNGDEKRNKGEVGKRGDHGWAMCLVQKPSSTKPDYVIAVVVEYGGSGSHVAGPIANQILYAMNAEGYL